MNQRPKTLVVGALCALMVVSLGSVLGAASAFAGSGSGGSANQAALTLLSQSPWVGPGQSFSTRLALSGRLATSSADLEVTVYSHLTSRSAFNQTLTSTPTQSVLSQSIPVAVSSLQSDPAGGFDVTVQVATGPGGGTAAPSPFAVDLDCALGSCGGVYPVVFSISNSSNGATVTELNTYLVYDAPPSNTEPLRLALVVPAGLSAEAAGRNGRVAPPTAHALGSLDALTGALGLHDDVPVTLVPDPASAEIMAGDTDSATRARAHDALDDLADLSAQPARQVLCGPFTTVDPSALLTDGLGTELTDQVHRGTPVLASAGIHTAGCAGTVATWVATATLDPAAISALESLGYGRVVVTPSSVAGPAPPTTPARLFTLTTARSTGFGTGEAGSGGGTDTGTTGDAGLTAVLSDPGLEGHLQAASGPTPVLAAYQFLAELALIYYEAPNTPAPRGVVVVAPDAWAPGAGFLSDALAGLDQNPVVRPVTLDDLFSEVPAGGVVGGYGQPSVRRPAVGSEPAATGLPARDIRATRQRVDGFAAAVGPSGASTARALEDLLLMAESDQLRPAQQQAGVAGAGAALDTQLQTITIRTDSIRLTSISASVPITVLRGAPYPVTGTLCLSSDKLVFPSGHCRTVVLESPTNAFTFLIKARASGDFRMSVTFTSPDDHLVLAGGELTVRSMSTSAVAIALSVAAAVVLLVWWGRTVWRGRRSGSGRGAHVRRSRRERHRDAPGGDGADHQLSDTTTTGEGRAVPAEPERDRAT